MILKWRNVLVVLALAFITGCRTASPPSPQADAEPAHVDTVIGSVTRDNCIALLDDLLRDEKNLSKVLLIKRESPELERLVKDISETAAEGSDFIKKLRPKETRDEPLDLRLPPGEKAAREAIAKTKQQTLLHSSGAEFEFQLLLTQIQALSYGSHLASVIAEQEHDAAVAGKFSALSAQLRGLYERVVERVKGGHFREASNIQR